MENTPNRVLRLPEVVTKLGIGRTSIYKWMNQGLFPQSIHLGPRSVGWLESDIDNWLKQKTEHPH